MEQNPRNPSKGMVSNPFERNPRKTRGSPKGMVLTVSGGNHPLWVGPPDPVWESAMVATASWCGWFRPNKKIAWVKLAEGNTYSAALDALLDALASRKGGESMVLPAGRHPADPVARMAR
jgi:hypothetical protein